MNRRWRRLLLVAVLALGGSYTLASIDRCGAWPNEAPRIHSISRGKGELRAGASTATVQLDGSVTLGGYGPVRSSASGGDAVRARATVLSVGGTRVGVVSLDILLVTQPLVTAIRDGFDYPILVTATHTHSSVGQFDRRPVAQIAALGLFDSEVERRLIAAARSALEAAHRSESPASLAVRSFQTTNMVRARSGQAADSRGLEVSFISADRLLARWLLLGAHPTLAQRRASTLDTDWPGYLADHSGDAVTLVLQTSVGNASIDKQRVGSEAAVFEALTTGLADAGTMEACDNHTLAIASARVDLPHPDGSRIAPWVFRSAVENGLCASQEMDAEVMFLRIGCLSLLAVPFETTASSAQALERASGATRVISLANGYAGYVEPEETAHAGTGETKRQWFGPELLDRISQASVTVAATLSDQAAE